MICTNKICQNYRREQLIKVREFKKFFYLQHGEADLQYTTTKKIINKLNQTISPNKNNYRKNDHAS